MTCLSVVIVTYNSGEIVLRCLESVFAGDAGIETEVIVVDNASQDDIPARIAARFPQVHLIHNADNRGFSAANNVGLQAAAGEYLLLLNPDVIVAPDAMPILVDYLKRNPQVGVIGPHTRTGTGDLAITAHGPYTPVAVLWQFWGLGRRFLDVIWGTYRQRLTRITEPFSVAWVQACCLMFRRSVYERIGGLDEGFFMFSEDPDFCERAARAGWSTVFHPGAHVVHHESTTVSRYPLVKMRHYHLSPLHYFRKRGQYGAVRLLKAGFVIELAVKYLIRAIQERLPGRAGQQAKLAAYPVVLREVWRA